MEEKEVQRFHAGAGELQEADPPQWMTKVGLASGTFPTCR